jgi:hypothetical protein
VNRLATTIRELSERRPGHLVVSAYLDLDPENFATPPARASQIDSLFDEARKQLEARDDLDHDDRVGLRADLERVKEYLLSDEPPFAGARALGVFCSARADLFEVVSLPRSVPARVLFEPAPYVEPMLEAATAPEWVVLLVSRRDGRVFTGAPDTLSEVQAEHEGVHGQHMQGGWSQARYERSVENEVDDHLRRMAEIADLRLRRDRYDRLAIGGPEETVPRLEGFLTDEVKAVLVPDRVSVDVAAAGESDVREAIAAIASADETRAERDELDRLQAGIGTGGRGVAGLDDTVAALNERRVEVLLLDPGFDASGGRCPADGVLVAGDATTCPADGTRVEPVEHLREALAAHALAQDATVRVVRHHIDEIEPHGGIAAVLRF